ncbi:hypothetical protein AB0K34_11105 [Actinomadura sp. NPDC049382]|uniref:hypothetical protein n=1 Tax=Actinomadura sp. NPDC049382 TaxID=3158220 RepID=UPI003443E269
MRRLCAQAAQLVNDLDSQRAREAAAFEEGYRLAFDAGRDVGYRQAEADMQAAWKPIAASVRDIPRQMQVNENRRKPVDTIPCYCTYRGGFYCKTLVDVPARVDYRHVLCATHAPKTACQQHRQMDACAYRAKLMATQRPEFTGLSTAKEDAA